MLYTDRTVKRCMRMSVLTVACCFLPFRYMMGILMSNAGGAWDNAKKLVESGFFGPENSKGSDWHKATVAGDTVGDPFKDTSGPSMNILIKLMTTVGLVSVSIMRSDLSLWYVGLGVLLVLFFVSVFPLIYNVYQARGLMKAMKRSTKTSPPSAPPKVSCDVPSPWVSSIGVKLVLVRNGTEKGFFPPVFSPTLQVVASRAAVKAAVPLEEVAYGSAYDDALTAVGGEYAVNAGVDLDLARLPGLRNFTDEPTAYQPAKTTFANVDDALKDDARSNGNGGNGK